MGKTTTVWIFQIGENSQEKIWTWPRNWNLKKETEFSRTAAQNNAIGTNYIKPKIDYAQKNSKCRLCGNNDQTTNHLVSECSKRAQKE